MVRQEGKKIEFSGRRHDLRDYSNHFIKLQCPRFSFGLSAGFRKVKSRYKIIFHRY